MAQERERLARILRFGCRDPRAGDRPRMTLGDIARLLGVSVSTVCSLLGSKQGLSSRPQSIGAGRPKKLTTAHEAFLRDPATLRSWAAKTLEERAILFHRWFPEVKVSASTIGKFYKAQGIRKKAIVIEKVVRETRGEKL